jgi:hypothetical protein
MLGGIEISWSPPAFRKEMRMQMSNNAVNMNKCFIEFYTEGTIEEGRLCLRCYPFSNMSYANVRFQGHVEVKIEEEMIGLMYGMTKEGIKDGCIEQCWDGVGIEKMTNAHVYMIPTTIKYVDVILLTITDDVPLHVRHGKKNMKLEYGVGGNTWNFSSCHKESYIAFNDTHAQRADDFTFNCIRRSITMNELAQQIVGVDIEEGRMNVRQQPCIMPYLLWKDILASCEITINLSPTAKTPWSTIVMVIVLIYITSDIDAALVFIRYRRF